MAQPFQAWIIPIQGDPPYPSQGPGFPTHPIAPGGGGAPPYPSQGPGFPTHPIAPGGPPPTAEHPIVIPPKPEVTPPDVKPEHPIVIPPAGMAGVEWKMVFRPDTGWLWALVPTGEVPIPMPKK